jgi:transcription factor E
MLNIDKIKEIVEDMDIELDEQTQEILEILSETPIISENTIAEKLEIKINAARKSLYKLHSIGFVEYTKEKDAEKKWWYIYFWDLNQKKLLDIYLRHKQKIAKKNEETIVAEREFEFQTKDGLLKFKYEEALANDFVSPKNGRPLVQIDNLNFIQQLETDIQTLNIQITDIKLLQEKYKEEMTKVIVAEEVPEAPKKKPKKRIVAKAAKKSK